MPTSDIRAILRTACCPKETRIGTPAVEPRPAPNFFVWKRLGHFQTLALASHLVEKWLLTRRAGDNRGPKQGAAHPSFGLARACHDVLRRVPSVGFTILYGDTHEGKQDVHEIVE